ncbi:hypothetical protein ACTWQB_04430 [Piscibacillus sp. B03]|uniref:hypothetical protein n=1 Tax=Piscibacillus sp. B03 TaxID=3457430 RepID=UPI003FCDD023
MKVIDTVNFFLENYEPTLSFMEKYHQEYPEIFDYYFTYHAKNTTERHEQSIKKYPQSLSSIKIVHQRIKPIISEVNSRYQELYSVDFPVNVNLFVGCYGSNAYTHRQYIPDVSFSLERLSPVENHLKVIVAHEFGHAAHQIISDQKGIDWKNVQWESPLNWIFAEGVATHLSRQIVPGLKPTTYFSYNDNGEKRLLFFNENKSEIIQSFYEDYKNVSTRDLFKEWFSINGGQTYGHTRLAYFIGDAFFQEFIIKLGEMDAIVAWRDPNFTKQVDNWFNAKMV